LQRNDAGLLSFRLSSRLDEEVRTHE
jgi:hypothetical protein